MRTYIRLALGNTQTSLALLSLFAIFANIMKKTIILILAALMTISVSSAATIESAAQTGLADKKPAKKKKDIREVTFHVHLHCKDCVNKVMENIAFEKGVKDLEVSLENQTVAIKYDAAKTSEAILKAAIEKLGYPVLEEGHVHGHEGHDHK